MRSKKLFFSGGAANGKYQWPKENPLLWKYRKE